MSAQVKYVDVIHIIGFVFFDFMSYSDNITYYFSISQAFWFKC